MKTEPTQVERASSPCSDSTPDTTRRDALTRSITPRLALCSENELRMFDILLTQLEHERDDSEAVDKVVRRLRNDRFNENEGSARDMAYKRGWNACSRHDEAIHRIERGLTELRRQSSWPDESPAEQLFPFDLGGES